MRALSVWLPVLVALKALDVLLIGPQLLTPVAGIGLGSLLLLGAIGVLVAPRWVHGPQLARGSWALVTVVLVVMLAGPLYRNHVLFLAWIAAIMALVGDRPSRRLLLTSHLSVVYAFATLAKLSPTWLSGGSLEAWGARLYGLPVSVAAWGTVLVEALLAVAVWRPARWSLAVAIVVHATFVLGMAGGPYDLLRLTVFNGTAVAVWSWLYAEARTEPAVWDVLRASPAPR